VRVRDEDRRQPRGEELEDRPTRARRDQVGRSVGVGERVDVRMQVVVRGRAELVEPTAQVVVVAPARRVQHGERRRPSERLERRLVQRAGAERAAEHQEAALVGADPEPLARRGAVRPHGPGGHGTADHLVGIAGAALDRERQEHVPRKPRQQPVRNAEVAVGLRQHERDPARDRSQPNRPRHVAAAAQHHVGARLAHEPARPAHRARGQRRRPRCLQRVAPVETGHRQRMERVAGGGHELGLRPLAPGELDVRAPSA
jgi:hypothetical protein